MLILCDFGASALCALLLLFPGPPLPFLLTGTMLFHLLSHLFEIASKVLFSELCPLERLSSLNGIKSLLDHGAAVLAPAAGALLFGLCGFRAILLLCALAYGLSAIPAIGVTGIWWSVPIGWGLADLAGLLYYKARKPESLA